MSNTWKILTVVLLALVLAQGAGLLYLWQEGQQNQAKHAAAALAQPAAVSQPASRPLAPLPLPASPATNQAANQANPAVAAAQPAPSYLPAPVQPMPGVGQSRPGRAGAQNPNALRAERARLVQQKIRELTANGRQPSPAELDPILQELAEIQGPNGSVNIQALRDNLKVAERMQKLAEDLQAEIKKPQPQQDMAKIRAIQESIMREQSGLRLDFMAGGALQTPPQQPVQPPPTQQRPAGQ
jgi:hypothetical protein